MTAQSWLAHRVQRYHTNPHLALYGQTNADHAWGVAAIIAWLKPDASADLLRAALFHDAGEYEVGDLPAPFKQLHPAIAEQHREAEAQAQEDLSPEPIALTEVGQQWLRLADMVEAIMFTGLRAPHLLETPDWGDQIAEATRLANELGVLFAVADMITEVLPNGGEAYAIQ